MSLRSPSPNRRAVLASLGAAMPAAVIAAPALAAPGATAHPDAELMQIADTAVALFERAGADASTDNESAAMLAQVDELISTVIALPASTREGLAAKARLLRTEYSDKGMATEHYGPTEYLVLSIISDLIRQGDRA